MPRTRTFLTLAAAVMMPLAILFFEHLLPGSKLSNRLTDLGYRVQAVSNPEELLETVRREKPIVLIADLSLRRGDLCGVIASLRDHPDTSHVPILGFTQPSNTALIAAAVAAGAKLVAADSGIIEQLPRLLDHVLAVD